MKEAYAVVSESELAALRSALAAALDALERLERGLIEDPLGPEFPEASIEELAKLF